MAVIAMSSRPQHRLAKMSYRAAALCDSQQISDIIGVGYARYVHRPIYAGNAIATVKSSDIVKFITVRSTAFGQAAFGGGA